MGEWSQSWPSNKPPDVLVKKIKMRAGDFLIPVTVETRGKSLYFRFTFNRPLLEEIKSMDGAKWHGYDDKNPEKVWSVHDNARNRFQIQYLRAGSIESDSEIRIANPYDLYDKPLPILDLPPRYNKKYKKHLPYMAHQKVMTSHFLTRRQCLCAGEMGTGKTLAVATALEIFCKEMNQSGIQPSIWYLAPKSALMSVLRDLDIWGFNLPLIAMTYNELVKRMKQWRDGDKPPPMIIFDESQRVKTPTSQRGQAALAISNGIREDWGDYITQTHGQANAVVIEMSGSPSPKSPMDWWHQAEIARPGFLKEGNIFKFKQRLAVIEKKENLDGGMYPELVTWRDSELKCKICGRLEKETVHDLSVGDICGESNVHTFEKGINEVSHLYERLKGLVLVYFKKDCMDLPDKHYRVIELKPCPSLQRVANSIVKSSPTVIQGLTALRELSDGFQYVDVPIDEPKTCSLCQGTGLMEGPVEVPDSCPNCKPDQPCENHNPKYGLQKITCSRCGGKGSEQNFKRETKEIQTPKEDLLVELLEEHEEVGRFVVFAGFTGSLDRIERVCHREGWMTIRIDRGKWVCRDKSGVIIPVDEEQEYLNIFQDKLEEYPRVAVVAHPKSGGVGLTLTASPSIFYYSNTFDAEDRIQSEERIHRLGMDLNKGATIIDAIHLESDRRILENLKKKRDLQSITMGDFRNEFLDGEQRSL